MAEARRGRRKAAFASQEQTNHAAGDEPKQRTRGRRSRAADAPAPVPVPEGVSPAWRAFYEALAAAWKRRR
ncbi:hypothetical protein [Alicyclobacillus sp.]|uniref:hypothetical protein n=1 Tax=Alicyclobacillus sp. TaxID=61169 RepID=UPI0025BFB21C|nr:hypothetical protein [Alicyclobacillus sp.]MCL6517759.1 hypothetical protein [Alicyclobacillus sp.]